MYYLTNYLKKTTAFVGLAIAIFAVNNFAQTKQTERVYDDNCENNKSMFAAMVNYFAELGYSDKSPSIKLNTPVIVIARLGAKERSNIYNLRRLNVIRNVYFKWNPTGLAPPVFAQGEKLKEGKGRVEVYYGGIMRFAITADHNQNLKDCYSDPRWATD